jgi:glycine/D-amino acid oxidase-like deaminating enzyme/nitrite reductase/ring-hydroxylating ferredoxin subunit
MAQLDGTPYWQDASPVSRYPALDRDVTVDVAVIGAGITGLTAAYLLKQAGRSVAVIDRGRVAGMDTGHTTAHVTCVTDLDLSELVTHFGRDHARAAWDAGLAAIAELDSIISSEAIDCRWEWVPGYKFAALTSKAEEEGPRLQKEAALAVELGFDAKFLEAVPFFDRPGIELGGQARFHPRKYLAALAALVDGGGSHLFEHTESEEVADDPLSVKASGHTISCDYVVIATHTPLMGKTNIASASLLQTKLYLYSSYVLGGRVPKGTIPDALFWDTADPYHYLRLDPHRDYDYVIFGGQDHKTGQAGDTEACYRALERTLDRTVSQIEMTHRWSGQVVETNDGLPFIGETSPRQFAATGYGGNGMTFGTLAAMMGRDKVLGRPNPWSELFDIGRTKVKGGAWDYLKENKDYPYYLIRDRFAGAQGTSLRALGRGKGKILEIDGERVAAFRSDGGKVTLLSPICTHLGCVVAWNDAESTWDCPCHGSRFRPGGEVISGPAESPLAKRDPGGSNT